MVLLAASHVAGAADLAVDAALEACALGAEAFAPDDDCLVDDWD